MLAEFAVLPHTIVGLREISPSPVFFGPVMQVCFVNNQPKDFYA